MNKILCVVGSTGSGKTNKAIELSKEQPSILISADSRQVYRGMDIVTGKDHPKDIVIHGLDIVNPDEPCSVAVWYDHVAPVIKNAWNTGVLPIIVGGTGLYIKSLTDGIETIGIPINYSLRDELNTLSIPELQNKLRQLNLSKYESMNQSDINNSRRIIRAIEIITFNNSAQSIIKVDNNKLHESSIIGLKYSDESIHRNIIIDRVKSRLKQGAIEETEKLLSKYDSTLPSMTALGYKSIIKYLRAELSREDMIEDWIGGEVSYAKRQMTWFRKQPVIWYDK